MMKKYSPIRKIVFFIFFLICRVFTGVRPKYLSQLSSQKNYIYYANHSSHLDGIIILACFPHQERERIYFVVAADYWKKTFLRRYCANSIFNTILINRHPKILSKVAMENTRQTLDSMEDMHKVLDDGNSLIIFPEGTRGYGQSIADFKSGIWHLSRKHPEISLVPVYLDNLHRVLPKGSFLAVPMMCKAIIGKPVLATTSAETKQEFLSRLKQSLEVTYNGVI